MRENWEASGKMSQKDSFPDLYRVLSGRSKWLFERVCWKSLCSLCGCRPDRSIAYPNVTSREWIFTFWSSCPNPARSPSEHEFQNVNFVRFLSIFLVFSCHLTNSNPLFNLLYILNTQVMSQTLHLGYQAQLTFVDLLLACWMVKNVFFVFLTQPLNLLCDDWIWPWVWTHNLKPWIGK
jgi:hypothetical protein